MKTALETGIVLHAGPFVRVLYHEGRQQPASLWVLENDKWHVVRYYRDSASAMARERSHTRDEGGSSD